MWMTSFFREVKRQLRDVYRCEPYTMRDGELCFEFIPDGLYPMEIEGKVYQVAFIDQKMHVLQVMKPLASGAANL